MAELHLTESLQLFFADLHTLFRNHNFHALASTRTADVYFYLWRDNFVRMP